MPNQEKNTTDITPTLDELLDREGIWGVGDKIYSTARELINNNPEVKEDIINYLSESLVTSGR